MDKARAGKNGGAEGSGSRDVGYNRDRPTQNQGDRTGSAQPGNSSGNERVENL